MAYALDPITVTATTATLSREVHGEAMVVADHAAGITFTLPASNGTGAKFRIFVKTTISSNNLIVQVANANDIIQGVAVTDNSGTATSFATGSTDDTVTMNGTTKGGYKGDLIEVEDVASGIWHVSIIGKSSGTSATPFSAAVS